MGEPVPSDGDGRKTIVLLGVGHTHAHVVRAWRDNPIADTRLVCVSNHSVATYSGLLPAALAGLVPERAMQIDLEKLCRGAGAELVLDEVVGCDPQERLLRLANREPLRFDALSVGVGSVPVRSFVVGDPPGVVAIKPMQTLLERLATAVDAALPTANGRPLRVLIVGGGVAGVEVAFCLPGWFERHRPETEAELVLVEGSSIAAGLSQSARARVHRELERRRVQLEVGSRVDSVDERWATLADGRRLAYDVLLVTTPATSPSVLGTLGLSTDDRGFLLTEPTLRCLGDAPVFAVGDSGSPRDAVIPKAGVYAVRQGPVLRENLRREVEGRPLLPFRPQKDFLRLLNTGDGQAIADYRGRSAHARWCWWWKRWLDERFMARYR